MQKRQNFSRKREAIYQAICNTKIHPSADWVYQTLKPQYPDLSLGTVYRNIAQFRKEGRIISVGVVDGQERYDADITPHSHFVCSCCGDVLDIMGDFLSEELRDQVSREYNVQVKSSEILFRGICSECQKRA